MADVTASEVTRIAEYPLGDGYDLVLIEFFIEHTIVTNDAITAAVLGIDTLMGIVGASYVSSGDLTTGLPVTDANGITMQASARTVVAGAAAGAATTPISGATDRFTIGSIANGGKGLWLLVLAKAN